MRKILFTFLVILMFLASFCYREYASLKKMRGMRVNPGYLYDLVSKQNKGTLARNGAEQVVREAKSAGVNALLELS